MGKGKVFIISVVLLSIVVGLFLISENKGEQTLNNKTESYSSPEQIEELELTTGQRAEYYRVYENPFVLHVRKALNGYLDGTNEGMATPEFTIKARKVGETLTGLDSFDKEYYRSKFIVYTMVDNIAGGKLIHIIFQDRPDKMFAAWVYQLVDDTYDFRDFWQSTQFDEEKMAEVRKIFKQYLEDKEHAL